MLNNYTSLTKIQNITARALVVITGAPFAYKAEKGGDIMKKKILSMTLAGIMALGTMTGCGSAEGSSVSASGTTKTETSAE